MKQHGQPGLGEERRIGFPLSMQMVALLVGGLVVAQLTTLCLALLWPAPAPVQYRLGDIAAALHGQPVQLEGARPLVISVRAAPPALHSAGWLVSESSRDDLARMLQANQDDVRLLFYSPLPFAGASGVAQAGPGMAQAAPPPRASPMVQAAFPLPALLRMGFPSPTTAGGGNAAGAPPPAGAGPGGAALPQGMVVPPPRRDGAGPGPVGVQPLLPPGAIVTGVGRNGGRIVFQGAPAEQLQAADFHLGRATAPATPDVTAATAGAPSTILSSQPMAAYPGMTGALGGPGEGFVGAAVTRGPIATAARAFNTISAPAPVMPAQDAAQRVTPIVTVPTVIIAAVPAVPAVPAALELPAPVKRPAARLTAEAAPLGAPTAQTAPRAAPAAKPEDVDGGWTITPRASEDPGLLRLGPPSFVQGDFVAAVRVAPGKWMTVQPRPQLAPTWALRVILWFVISVSIVAPLGFLFARRLAAPMVHFADAAERLGRDPSGAVIELRGPAEIGRAAEAFNLMQSRLKRFIDDRTAMVGAISHDLRTPLARMRFRLERAPEALKEGMTYDIAQMEDMISSVLVFIRDASEPSVREQADFLSIVECVVDDAAITGGEAVLQEGEPMSVDVDTLAIQRVVQNLVDNALKYGGEARVTLFRDGQDAVAEIADRGPGLDENQLERVFLPFYRSDEARGLNKPGIGLGLAVSRSIARGHGGDVTLRNGEDGGLIAQLRLPLARPHVEAQPLKAAA